MSAEPTIRAHLEAIRDGVQTSATNRAILRRETELLQHAVAALALLDNAVRGCECGYDPGAINPCDAGKMRWLPDPGSAATHKETP